LLAVGHGRRCPRCAGTKVSEDGQFLVDVMALAGATVRIGLVPIYLGVRMTGDADVVSSI
jgi:hypothetical protein